MSEIHANKCYAICTNTAFLPALVNGQISLIALHCVIKFPTSRTPSPGYCCIKYISFSGLAITQNDKLTSLKFKSRPSGPREKRIIWLLSICLAIFVILCEGLSPFIERESHATKDITTPIKTKWN